jgi:hypothetical protein
LTLRYNAFGLTIAVRDYRPDRMPEPPPVDPEPQWPPPGDRALFVVGAVAFAGGDGAVLNVLTGLTSGGSRPA